MKVKIKRIDKSIPLPFYETDGAVGFDIIAREYCSIPPKEISLIPTNLIIAVPPKYMLVVASRSSTPSKKGLAPPHGFGIIDHDYCGPKDEVKVMVYNFKDNPVVIERGEKIAQGVFVRIDKFEWEEVDEVSTKSRGGFGSTGGYKNID
ncbi:dUTP diphosphatase [Candidatus Peregrinibacteria bacterium]|nr:dUTP diphosphatase [Candidatus Peregrinibacteria bacterium]